MTGTEIIFMTFLIIVALVATALLCMALYEFIRTIREDRTSKKETVNEVVTPKVVEEIKAVEEVVEEKPVEEPAEEVKGFVPVARKPLDEEYSRLTKNERLTFDKIKQQISELEKVRVIESKFKITAMQGQDKIAKLEIVNGEIRLSCFLVDSELKKYAKENGQKIKTTQVKFKFNEDPKSFEAAMFTLDVANNKALEARGLATK